MPNELPGAGLGSSGIGGSSDGANGDFMSIIGALKTEEMNKCQSTWGRIKEINVWAGKDQAGERDQ